MQHTDGGNAGPFGNTTCLTAGSTICVPNPPDDAWEVACGWLPPSSFGATSCYGYYEGKDFIIDDATGAFYDVSKLFVDAQGHPISGASGSACGSAANPCPVRGIYTGLLAQSDGVPGGTDAAGTASGAGVIMPGELDCPTCLNHVVKLTVPQNVNNTAICAEFPAVSTDGSVTGAGAFLCEGAKVRYTGDWTALDPSTHSTVVIALARALSIYGGIIVGQGGDCTAGGSGCVFAVKSDYDSSRDMTGSADITARMSIYYGGTQLH